MDYPYVKYAQIVPEMFLGAMENTSATTHSYRLLPDERASLDFTPDAVVAHELVHQWFGDLLAVRDWAHIWLKESFATYYRGGLDASTTRAWTSARTDLRDNLQLVSGGRQARTPPHRLQRLSQERQRALSTATSMRRARSSLQYAALRRSARSLLARDQALHAAQPVGARSSPPIWSAPSRRPPGAAWRASSSSGSTRRAIQSSASATPGTTSSKLAKVSVTPDAGGHRPDADLRHAGRYRLHGPENDGTMAHDPKARRRRCDRSA